MSVYKSKPQFFLAIFSSYTLKIKGQRGDKDLWTRMFTAAWFIYTVYNQEILEAAQTSRPQVAHTRPAAESGPPPCFYLAAAPSSCIPVKE